jgi:hypothetical protein
VPEIKINPNGTLRNVIEVWENVGGTLKQVWPDTAYDGSHFAGELRGGVLTNGIFARDSESSLSGMSYYYMNNFTDSNVIKAITSGGLYRNISNAYGPRPAYETLGETYGFISAGTIDFSKYRSVRVAGVAYYYYNMDYNAGLVDIWSLLTVSPIYKSGTKYIRRSGKDVKSGHIAGWYNSTKFNEYTNHNSGNIAFDVTLDISAWTTTDYIGFQFDQYVNASIDTFAQRGLNFSITRIEFIK